MGLGHNSGANYSQLDFERACQQCVSYARYNLSPFISAFNEEVLELMGALSFVQAIAFDSKQAPYANLFTPELKHHLV